MSDKKQLGIVGAGIMGRLLAYFALKDGWQVTIYEKEAEPNPTGTSAVAAGMIAPYCEMEYGEPTVSRLGFTALDIWEELLKELKTDVLFQRKGSLVVSHPQDRPELGRLINAVRSQTDKEVFRKLDTRGLMDVEPDLETRFGEGLYFPLEGQIDSREALTALGGWLKENGVAIHFNTEVHDISPGAITTADGEQRFDMVADCRGLDGKAALEDLRGIRGEVVRLHAPDVTLTRPVRLMHPRYPIYIVPRRDNTYVIGATSVENDDLSPISVRGALELMSAAYSLHPGFGEARVVETAVQCRPAFADNAPRVYHGKGLVRINGLYRHGYLATPALAKLCAAFIGGQEPPEEYSGLFIGV